MDKDIVWVKGAKQCHVISDFKNICYKIHKQLSFSTLYISTVKAVLSGHSKRRPKIDFQDRLSLNAGLNY